MISKTTKDHLLIAAGLVVLVPYLAFCKTVEVVAAMLRDKQIEPKQGDVR